MEDSELQRLLQQCDQIVKLPSSISEAEAEKLFQDYPLARVFQLLSTHQADDHQLEVVCGALDKALSTQQGTALLPAAQQYAEAALDSPQHRLRLLGVQQLGRLLLLLDEAAAAGSSGAGSGHSDVKGQVEHLEQLLVGALKDDTGVAGAAERALLSHFTAQPAAFSELLAGSSAAGQDLAQLAGSSSATQRMRAFALLVTAAAGGNRQLAEQLKQAGVVQQLLGQLNPRDPLSCLVALQLLQELVPHLGGAAAGVTQELLLPALLQLLNDPATAPGAFPIAAQLVAAAAEASSSRAEHHAETASMEVDQGSAAAVAAANGNGVCEHDSAADVLLSKMAVVLDDRGSASTDEELVVLDATHQLASTSAAAATLLTTPAAAHTLAAICTRALGRTSSPEVRLAALHALASIAGLERAGEARDRSAALLAAPGAEDALRQAVFAAVSGTAGGAGGARTPAEAVWALLQQPFDETRTGTYRCCSALALRPWFAAEVVANSALLARLCRTDSETGQQACEWRHSAVMALWAAVQHVVSLPDDAHEAQQYKARLPAAVQQQLAAAARGGPYGVGGGHGTQQSHFVATVP